MSIYLIDYENTGISGLTGIETLKKNDRVYLFYGIYTGSITFDTHIALNNTKAKIKYIKIDKSAKNYLDFQLATMSGYLIAKNKDTNFIIVSRDNGFNSVVDFWSSYHSEKKPITITRQIAIAPTDEMLAQEEQRHTSPARAPRRGRSGSFRSRRSPRTTETAVKETSAKDIKEKEETAPAPVTTPTHSNAVPHEPVVSTPVQKSAAPEQGPVIEKPATKESVSKTTVPAETEKKSSEPRSLGPRAETRLQPVAAAPTREKEVPAAYTRIGPVIPAPSHTEPAATKPVEPKAHDSAVAYARLTPVAAEKKEPEQKVAEPTPAVPEASVQAPVQTPAPTSKAAEKPAPVVSAPAVLPVKEENGETPVSSSKEQVAEPDKPETASHPEPEETTKPAACRPASRKAPAKKEPAVSPAAPKEEPKKEAGHPSKKPAAAQKTNAKKPAAAAKPAGKASEKKESAPKTADTTAAQPTVNEKAPAKKTPSRTRSRQAVKKEAAEPKKAAVETEPTSPSKSKPAATSAEKILSAPKKEIPKLTEHYKKRIRDRIRVEGLRSGAYNEIYRLILKSTDLTGTRSGLIRLFGEEKGNSLFSRMEDICEEYLREKREDLD